MPVKCIYAPHWLRLMSALRRLFCYCGFVVYCCSHCLWGFYVWTLFLLFNTLCTSSVAISWMVKREPVPFALIVSLMYCDCWCSVTLPRFGIQCVIVVFPDHTHKLFSDMGNVWLPMIDVGQMLQSS